MKHEKCVKYDSCDWRKSVGYCPENCNHFKDRDEVVVVRCRDCKHMEKTPDCLRWCNVWNGINGMGDKGFCNYGERKTDE